MAVISLAMILLAGCATSSFAGIEFAPGAAEPELQSLAGRARAGDKYAQLELGIRYEEGRGLPRDLARAKRLYALAAADAGGTIWVYSPPVRKGESGRVIPIDRGPAQPGLAEAARRLKALRHDGAR